jgi:AraC-like DNA-binding protein
MKPTVAAGLFRGFADYAAGLGADRAALLAAAGVPEALLRDQDARIPLAAYQALIEAAISATGDSAIAIRYSIGTPLDQYSIVGLIVHSSASMADSMVQLNRYNRLMIEVDVMDGSERYSVVQENDQVWIVDNRPDPNRFAQLTETAFGRFIGEFRRSFPDRPFAIDMQVTHPAPAHAAEYRALFRTPVTFAAPRNAIRIDPYWLTVEFEDTSRYVFGVFADRADALLAALEDRQSTRARVEAALLPLLHKGPVSVDVIAQDMGMSRQTLYRRLKDEGTTYADVLDDLRHRMARDYLSARKVSVNQTAYLVGFSEPSSFVRAFRRWTGSTPTAFLS